MTTICDDNLKCNIQKSLNAVCVTCEADVFVYAGAATNIYDATNRVISVATVENLPDISSTNLSTGTIMYVENLCIPVIYSNGCWIGMDGRLLLGNINRVYTWGLNTCGRLGDGSLVTKSSPVTTSGGGTLWCQVSAGGSHTAAIRNSGQMFTWGNGACGMLGSGQLTTRCVPGTVVGNTCDWRQVSAGLCHTVAVKTNGSLWTWGLNTSGRLGDGTVINRSSPVQTSVGGLTWCQVNTQYAHTGAVKTDGTLWTWGFNTNAQLGDNTVTTRSFPGTVSGGGTNWCQVGTGDRHTAAIKTDGTLWTWGYNGTGQLGDATITSRRSPGTTSGGGTDWCRTSGGCRHTAAVKTDGTAWTWGCNISGQLGSGVTTSRTSPGTLVGGGTDWCQISAGCAHTSAVKTDGTSWSWGSNASGQLGDNTVVNRSSPVCVQGNLCGWCQISSGTSHTAAINSVSI